MSTFDLHFWIYLLICSVYILAQIIPLCGERLIIKILSYPANWKEPLCQNRFPPFSLPHIFRFLLHLVSLIQFIRKLESFVRRRFHKIPLRRNLKTGEQQIQKYFRRLIQTPTERNNSNSTWGKSFICKLANAATKSELRWVISYFW